MIETKEQYEAHISLLKNVGEYQDLPSVYESGEQFEETIEALREVARLADEICNIGALVDEDEALDRELMLKMRALPDWLMESS